MRSLRLAAVVLLLGIASFQASLPSAASAPAGHVAPGIAFLAGDDPGVFFGSDQLYLEPTTGARPHPVGGRGNILTFAWSPDGSKLVFASGRDQIAGEIYVMNADGSRIKRLTKNTFGDNGPVW